MKEYIGELNVADVIQMGIFVGVLTLYLVIELKKIRIRRKRSLEENLKIDAEIYKILWHLQGTLKAIRVYVTQFHNGDNFYTGQSIQRQTVSHEVLMQDLGNGVMSLKPTHTDVLIDSLNHEIIMQCARTGIYYEKNIALVDRRQLAPWMQYYGVKSLYYFRINDKKGRMIAMLNLHFNLGDPIQDREVLHAEECKKKMEYIFNKI